MSSKWFDVKFILILSLAIIATLAIDRSFSSHSFDKARVSEHSSEDSLRKLSSSQGGNNSRFDPLLEEQSSFELEDKSEERLFSEIDRLKSDWSQDSLIDVHRLLENEQFPFVQAEAVSLLADKGTIEDLQAITDLFRSDHPIVVRSALLVLGEIAKRSEPSEKATILEELISFFESTHSEQQSHESKGHVIVAIEAISDVDHESGKEFLMQKIDGEKDLVVKYVLIEALRRFTSKDVYKKLSILNERAGKIISHDTYLTEQDKHAWQDIELLTRSMSQDLELALAD